MAEGFENFASKPKGVKVIQQKAAPVPAQPRRYAVVIKRKQKVSQTRKPEVLVNKAEGSTKSSAQLKKDIQVVLHGIERV